MIFLRAEDMAGYFIPLFLSFPEEMIVVISKWPTVSNPCFHQKKKKKRSSNMSPKHGFMALGRVKVDLKSGSRVTFYDP